MGRAYKTEDVDVFIFRDRWRAAVVQQCRCCVVIRTEPEQSRTRLFFPAVRIATALATIIMYTSSKCWYGA
jgi:hypothetical protein